MSVVLFNDLSSQFILVIFSCDGKFLEGVFLIFHASLTLFEDVAI
jgi:hypothetical protein